MAKPSSAPSSVTNSLSTINVLDQYDSSTYHFKLYMTTEKNVRDDVISDYSHSIVIAESGVTSIAIEDVVIETIPGMKGVNTGTATMFNFQLTEPLGSSLLDKMLYASKELGVGNYLKVPYFLELTFRGRNENTSAPIDDNGIGNKSWIWPIMITGMDISINASGTTYNTEAVMYDNLAYSNQIADLSESVSISAATVKEFLDQLGVLLSDRQKNRYPSAQLELDKFIFVYDKELGDEKIVDIDKDKCSEKGTPQNAGSATGQGRLAPDTSKDDPNNTKKSIQLNDGIDVLRAIDAVMSVTNLVQKESKNSVTAEDNNVGPKKQSNDTFKKLYRVYTDVKVLAYDPGRGDYSREFTYKIVKYDIATIYAQNGEAEVNTTTSQTRLDHLIAKGALIKKYNYIFTGLNDQVLEFDFNFNFAWFAPMAKQGGIFNQYSANDFGRQFHSELKNLKEFRSRIAKIVKNGQMGASASTDSALDAIRREVSSASSETLTEADKELLIRTIDQRKGKRVAPSSTQFTPKSKFATDTTLTMAKKAKTIPQSQIIPLSFIEDNESGSNEYAVEGSFKSGRPQHNSIFSQATNIADLLAIELKIKGDPFWLEPAPYISNKKTNIRRLTVSQIQETKSNNEQINSQNTQVFFMFRSFTPQEALDDTGVPPPFSNNTVINGIYAVQVVKNEFSQGLFTQTLSAARELLIDITNIKE